MSRSNAKKKRLKKEREGFRNPEERRYRNVGLTTQVKDKRKNVYKRNEKHKKRSPHLDKDQGDFVFLVSFFNFLLKK